MSQEWKHELRSSIHPLFFSLIYYLTGTIAQIARLSPLTAADSLIAAPKATQAFIAATGDYYTWKLAGKVYGFDSYGAWATVCFCGWDICICADGLRLASLDYTESVAMVLFNTNLFQLRRDYPDSSRTILVAMGLVP